MRITDPLGLWGFPGAPAHQILERRFSRERPGSQVWLSVSDASEIEAKTNDDNTPVRMLLQQVTVSSILTRRNPRGACVLVTACGLIVTISSK